MLINLIVGVSIHTPELWCPSNTSVEGQPALPPFLEGWEEEKWAKLLHSLEEFLRCACDSAEGRAAVSSPARFPQRLLGDVTDVRSGQFFVV